MYFILNINSYVFVDKITFLYICCVQVWFIPAIAVLFKQPLFLHHISKTEHSAANW